MKQHFLNVAVFVGILLIPQVAFAYLDAGTGSQILQIAIASLIGATLMFKSGWQRIKALFRKIFPDDSEGK